MRLSKSARWCHLAAIGLTLGMWAGAAAAHASAHAGAAKWDRRDFNGIWFLAMDDPDADPAAEDAAESKPGTAMEWGFNTDPELKGPYLKYYQQRRKADIKARRDCVLSCRPMGIPLITVGPYADEILQTPKQINWFQEFPGETWRIYLDGRPHRSPSEYPASLTGDSIGRWDGNTLVVDTINIRTDTLLYGSGPAANNMGHSDELHVVQRIRLLDKNHLQIKATVYDPKALVRPWQYSLTFDRARPGTEIIEYLCEDHNQEHLDPKTGQEITEIPPRHNPPAPPRK